MTLIVRHAEIDSALVENFKIRICANPRNPEQEFDLDSRVAICFEYDYPDRPGLELLRTTKARYPHIPNTDVNRLPFRGARGLGLPQPGTGLSRQAGDGE